jgi:hypothetical protein
VAPRFDRYERVYCTQRRRYCTLVMPGATGDMVVAHFGGTVQHPVSRSTLRRLRWWERLLNR